MNLSKKNKRYSYQNDRRNRRVNVRRKKRGTGLKMVPVLAVALLMVFFGTYRAASAFPAVYGTNGILPSAQSGQEVSLIWPAGQSAVGVNGYNLAKSSPNQGPVPTASIAKTITALAVLEKKPFNLGESGETITITQADEQILESYLVKGGSAVGISDGQQLTEYQALQYILISSANNIADTTVIWAFGSMEAYLEYANNMVDRMGLKTINVDDASGFSPKTVSSAEDLVSIGGHVMNNPVLADIVSQEGVDLPDGTGRKANTNMFLDFEGNGVVGIKSGYTDEANGTMLMAANRTIDGQQVIIIASVMGSVSPFIAQSDVMALINQAHQALENKVVISKGEAVGSYRVPWGGEVKAVSKNGVSVLTWKGESVTSFVSLNPVLSAALKGQEVGKITFNDQNFPIVLGERIDNPTLVWNTKHPFN